LASLSGSLLSTSATIYLNPSRWDIACIPGDPWVRLQRFLTLRQWLEELAALGLAISQLLRETCTSELAT
jgi:hypothetical protein